MGWLLGAIVQKVDRPAPFLWLLHVRAPGRSIALGVVATRHAVALGPLDAVPPKRAPADAETMRWRKELEGARVVEVSTRADRPWARVVFVRGAERRAIVATAEGARLHLDVGADPVGDLAGVALVGDDDEPRLAGAVALAVSAAIERDRDERRRTLVASIDRAMHKLDRRLAAVREDLVKIGQADALVARGTLLAAHAHAIPRGAREATLEDWSGGEVREVTLTLDPALPVRAQAEALFHRAKRMRRGATIAERRLAETARAREALAIARITALAAADDDALDALARRLGTTARPAPGVKGGRAEPRLPYHRFQSGLRAILVGRGAKDNDALTTKVARPHDLWLHAKGITGAHVVVPLDKGETCPAELLIDAAHLAAHFSDARGERVVEISHAPRRHVRKPRGSPPGAVVVDREKVLVLRVEPARITLLLASGNT